MPTYSKRFPPDKRWVLLLLVAVCLVLAGLAYVFEQGSSYHWTRIPPGVQEFGDPTIDWAVLTDDGNWLIWVEQAGVVSAWNLNRSGSVHRFQPESFLLVRPVTVVGDRLLVLRSSRNRGVLETLGVGIQRITGFFDRASDPDSSTQSQGSLRTTHLEAIDLNSGELASRFKGATDTNNGSQSELSGFEMGRVSVSPDNHFLAWWWAQENVNGTPVSATVVESFRTMNLDGLERVDIRKQLVSPGYFQVWTGMLSQIGTPLWVDSTTCLFLSFLDGGSIVPIDVAARDFAATLTLIELFQDSDNSGSEDASLPEGMNVAPQDASGELSLLFWGRDHEKLTFYSYHKDYVPSSTTTYETGKIDLSHPLWISGGRLLVGERETGQYLALSGVEERVQRFPAPPFTESEFKILGITSGERLAALFDSKFWIAKEGDDLWSELSVAP